MSDFFSADFMIGNDEKMNFLFLNAGINFSDFTRTLDPLPYQIPDMEYGNNFIQFSSERFGTQLGIGYLHYFSNTRNRNALLPVFSTTFHWVRTNDKYIFKFQNQSTDEETIISENYVFHTVLPSILTGLTYNHKNFYSKLILALDFFIPLNDHKYRPTSNQGSGSGFELPFVGFEPALELGIGYKLSGK